MTLSITETVFLIVCFPLVFLLGMAWERMRLREKLNNWWCIDCGKRWVE